MTPLHWPFFGRRGTWLIGLGLCLAAASAAAQTTAPAPGAPSADPSDPAQANISVTRPGTFEIHVQGADLRGVLQLLSTQGKRNIIATKEVSGTVTADLYGVTFEQALKAVLASTGYDYIEEEGFIYVHTPDQKAAILKSRVEPAVKVFRLAYITAEDAQKLIAPALSEVGSVAINPPAQVGISPSKTETGGNAYATDDLLVVRDLPANIEKIEKLIKELDVRPDQVLVETTILSAELTENNKLGINMNALAGPEWHDIAETTAALGGTDPSVFNAGPLNKTTNPTAVNFRTDFSPVTGGMTFGVYGSDMAFFLTALETVTDVTVLANPKLLVVNKQRGEVMVGRRDGYLTTTLTETTATQTVEFLETGTRLIVRPFIGRDGVIRMEIHPEDSDGSVQASLPSETTTEVTSNVLVRDGHTIVIGGLFRENTKNDHSQIPGLGNVPYLGSLFRTVDDATERDEVIILITPHVVNQNTDEAVGQQLKDDVERLRMGQRKGLAWWANERLADSHVRAAKKAVRDGNRDAALWNVDMALSLRPRQIEAIRLKERITQQAYWADENRQSVVRHVIQRMIMQDLGQPMDDAIVPEKPANGKGMDPEVRKAFGIEPRVLDPPPPAVTAEPTVEAPESAEAVEAAPEPAPAGGKVEIVAPEAPDAGAGEADGQ